MEQTELKIEQVPIEDLKPAEYNPRKWSEAARRGLTASLDEFGFVQPIVANGAPGRRGVIIGGNFKLSIAKEKGMKTVPVVWVNLPDLRQEKALNLRLNKNQGEFDLELLSQFDKELLADVGWESKEIDKIFDTDPEDDFNADAEAAKIVTPSAKPGEIWALGRHRLMCGDSSNLEDAAALMGGGVADMVFTDPPYNVNYSGRGKTTSTTIRNDNMDEADFRRMLKSWFWVYKACMKKDAALYCCYASRTHREFEDALNANGFEVRNQIIWVKKLASMGWGDYRWKHEPMLYCHQVGAPVQFYGDRKQYTEWTEEPSDEELLRSVRAMVKKDEEGASTVWRLGREMKVDHPTQKPVKLVSIAVRNSSKRDDIVLDLFAGSGSLMAACEGLNRKAYMMEIDERFCDVILKRYERLTGNKPQKIN